MRASRPRRPASTTSWTRCFLGAALALGDDRRRRAKFGERRSVAGRRAVVGRPAEAVALLCGAARGARDPCRGSDENAVAEVRELEAVKRAAARPVDPRAALAFRVPEACFVRVARFLYHAPRPPPTKTALDAEVRELEGPRRPPPRPWFCVALCCSMATFRPGYPT